MHNIYFLVFINKNCHVTGWGGLCNKACVKKMSNYQKAVKCQKVKQLDYGRGSQKKLTQWVSHIMMSILMSHMMVIKNSQSIKYVSWPILMTLICDIKTDIIMCEPHCVGFFWWISSTAELFDFWIHNIFMESNVFHLVLDIFSKFSAIDMEQFTQYPKKGILEVSVGKSSNILILEFIQFSLTHLKFPDFSIFSNFPDFCLTGKSCFIFPGCPVPVGTLILLREVLALPLQTFSIQESRKSLVSYSNLYLLICHMLSIRKVR